MTGAGRLVAPGAWSANQADQFTAALIVSSNSSWPSATV